MLLNIIEPTILRFFRAVKIIDIYKKEWYNKNAMDMQKIMNYNKKIVLEDGSEYFGYGFGGTGDCVWHRLC